MMKLNGAVRRRSLLKRCDMGDPLSLVETLEAVNLSKIASESLEQHEETIADLNASQMATGRRSDGSEILPSYADLTIELKSQKSGLAGVTDRVTLFDQGDHYRQLYADVQGEKIEFGSKDPKSEKLQEKYGDKIYGLGPDAKEELVEGHLRGTWQEKVEAATGLKFT
jgi:hypothetical protein